jgi:hypothetical protein
MNDCKYCKNEIIDGIKHEKCTNEDLKKFNKSDGKDIPCMGKSCGVSTEAKNETSEEEK